MSQVHEKDHVLRGHESSQVLRSLRYTSKEKEGRVKGKKERKSDRGCNTIRIAIFPLDSPTLPLITNTRDTFRVTRIVRVVETDNLQQQPLSIYFAELYPKTNN